MATPDAAFVADLARDTDRQVTALQRQLKDAQQIQRFVTAFSRALSAGHLSEAVRVLASHKKQLEILARANTEAADRIRSMEAELRTQTEDRFGDLPRDFPLAVQNAGLELDPSSRHPRYTFLDDFLEVRFDKAKLEAAVLPRDGRKAVLGADPDVVSAHVAAEVARLTGRPFDPRAFLTTLTTAYQAVRAGAGAGVGDNVPLKDVVAELAKDNNFRADEFNVDLSKLVRDKESAGRVALDNARDANNGMLLWQLDQRGYYGYIRVEG